MASGTFVSLTGLIDSNHHHGGGAMSAWGVAVFDKTLQTTNMRYDDLMAEQGPDRQLVWHVLGAVLHTLRYRLPAAQQEPQPHRF